MDWMIAKNMLKMAVRVVNYDIKCAVVIEMLGFAVTIRVNFDAQRRVCVLCVLHKVFLLWATVKQLNRFIYSAQYLGVIIIYKGKR